jgi:predicted AAA+ superfamily ATPase
MSESIHRETELRAVQGLLERHPVVALLGARQVGKTTLARTLAARRKMPVTFFDLEDARDLARLADPFLALEGLEGLVVLDEVQRRPQLFPSLRVLADRPHRPARFLLLGSASQDLLRQGAESLAGRIAFHELAGLALDEVGPEFAEKLWVRGGYPRSYLATDSVASAEWRENFVRTYLETDLPALGVTAPTPNLRRFWSMLAHYHGQTWNGNELAGSLGVSGPTVRRYLDLLESTFVARVLQPWSANLSKRQIKSPRVYISDTGILHTLLGIESMEDLLGHPKAGASWEGFALASTARHLGARPQECHFWATHGGAELDLLVVRGRQRRGFEFKRTSTPSTTRAMHIALTDLELEEIVLVVPGTDAFPIAPKVRVVGIQSLESGVAPL